MQEAHIQEVLNIHAAKLTEQDLAQQTALGGTADKDTCGEDSADCHCSQDRPPDDLAYHFFVADHLIDKYLKYKYEMHVVMALYKYS